MNVFCMRKDIRYEKHHAVEKTQHVQCLIKFSIMNSCLGSNVINNYLLCNENTQHIQYNLCSWNIFEKPTVLYGSIASMAEEEVREVLRNSP